MVTTDEIKEKITAREKEPKITITLKEYERLVRRDKLCIKLWTLIHELMEGKK